MKSAAQTDLTLLGALYAAELALVPMGLALHKLGERPLAAWPPTTPSLVFLAAAAVLIVALTLIGRAYLRRRKTGSRVFGFTVAMNLISVALVLIPFEIALRLLSRDSVDAPIFGDATLVPRDWNKAVSHNRELLQQLDSTLSYLVYDEVLGWTVAPNRRSKDGVHFSSAEGWRSAAPSAVLSGPTEKRRIAVVGDSYAFAEHVRFEESYGHLLEQKLGPDVQVVNFGVPGYGLDQAYLKFKTEVLPWKPDIVVLGFPEHDLFRTMTVYPFINWPPWNIPFSKPRFVLDNGQLRTLNIPTIPPGKIYAMDSVHDLPFLEYDQGYRANEWEHDALDVLYIKRWLVQQFPRWSEPPPHLGPDERLRLNSAILSEFVRTAKDNGIAPLILFFPTYSDLARRSKGLDTTAQQALKKLGVPVLDMAPCLTESGLTEDVYLPGDPHYSALGNAAVAKCALPALEALLAGQKTQKLATAAVHR